MRSDCDDLLDEAAPPWRLGDPYPARWVPVPHGWLALRNPRRGRVEMIKESIRENGWFGEITIQKHSPAQGGPRIVIGNHRYKAGRELEMDRFPIMVLDVDDVIGDRILLVDNRSSDVAGWEDPDLLVMLQDLQRVDMLAGSGFTEIDIEAILAGLGEPDPPPDRRVSDDVPIQAGTVKFMVSPDEFDEWMSGLIGEVGSKSEDHIAEVRHRLGFR